MLPSFPRGTVALVAFPLASAIDSIGVFFVLKLPHIFENAEMETCIGVTALTEK